MQTGGGRIGTDSIEDGGYGYTYSETVDNVFGFSL